MVQIAKTTISSLAGAYGMSESSRNSKLNQDITEARFVDEDGIKEDEDSEEEMKVED